MGQECSRNAMNCIRPDQVQEPCRTCRPFDPCKVDPKKSSSQPHRKRKFDTKSIMATIPSSRKEVFKDFLPAKSKLPQPGLQTNETGQTFLMLYVWYAEPPLPEIVEFMIETLLIPPDHIDTTGWSALHYAASNPFCTLQTLERLSCTAAQVSNEGQNALMMHLQYSNHYINKQKVRLLIRSGCDLTMLEPHWYFEIESQVMSALIADRMTVIQLYESRQKQQL